MASKLNSEFNYRYQVQGETIWEKIKTLKGFLVGRKRAAVLEEVQLLKTRAKFAKLEHLKKWKKIASFFLLGSMFEFEILELEAELVEVKSFEEDQAECWELNRQEIATLERLLKEAYEIAEPTRITGYTDEQMFEANAANEFTAWCAKEIHAEIIAHGHASPARIRNAMSNPHTWKALIQAGLIPAGNEVLLCSADPLKIEVTSPALPKD